MCLPLEGTYHNVAVILCAKRFILFLYENCEIIRIVYSMDTITRLLLIIYAHHGFKIISSYFNRLGYQCDCLILKLIGNENLKHHFQVNCDMCCHFTDGSYVSSLTNIIMVISVSSTRLCPRVISLDYMYLCVFRRDSCVNIYRLWILSRM
jgi:hypothetical protein